MKREEYFYNKGYRITDLGYILNPENKPIKGTNDSKGYIRINLRIESKHSYCFAHRLQAFQKYGASLYAEGIEVRHIDSISTNNSYNNIVIGTHSENMMDIPESIRIAKSLHATSFVRKYNKRKVREFYNDNRSYKKTMARFNISSKGTLHYILNSEHKI